MVYVATWRTAGERSMNIDEGPLEYLGAFSTVAKAQAAIERKPKNWCCSAVIALELDPEPEAAQSDDEVAL